MVKNVSIHKDNLFLFKEKVLKIEHPTGLSFVNLSSNPDEFELLKPETEEGFVTINLIGTCSINDYNQMGQIKIKDYEIVKQGAW